MRPGSLHYKFGHCYGLREKTSITPHCSSLFTSNRTTPKSYSILPCGSATSPNDCEYEPSRVITRMEPCLIPYRPWPEVTTVSFIIIFIQLLCSISCSCFAKATDSRPKECFRHFLCPSSSIWLPIRRGTSSVFSRFHSNKERSMSHLFKETGAETCNGKWCTLTASWTRGADRRRLNMSASKWTHSLLYYMAER